MVTGHHPVLDWFATRYVPMRKNSIGDPFALYVRRGGALEARLLAKSKSGHR
jgi:hypothetical protein